MNSTKRVSRSLKLSKNFSRGNIMVVNIKGKSLTSLFADFVGNNKIMFNFWTNGEVLKVQVIDDFTACVTLPVTSVDNVHKEVDISFWATKVVTLLNSELDVILRFEEACLIIEQNNFSSTFVKEYEERRQFPEVDKYELHNAFANRMKYITHSLVTCNYLSKELSISDPDPMFSGGKMYADYQQSFFIEHINYPELCLSIHALRGFVFKLEEDAEYYYFKELSTIYFKSGAYEFWVPTADYNINGSTINAVETKLQECMPVTEICIKDYVSKYQILATTFPKTKFTLSIGKNAFGVNVATNAMHTYIGHDISSPILSINITSGQLNVISKLFKDDESITVLRGGNCICLQSKEKSMLIAGLIY